MQNDYKYLKQESEIVRIFLSVYKVPLLIISKAECLLMRLKSHPNLVRLFCFNSTELTQLRNILGNKAWKTKMRELDLNIIYL